MATKPDLKAQKERKQKIVLAVLGVLLVGVAALQGPKLLKHSSSTKAAPAAVTTPGTTTGAVTTGAPTATPSSPSAAPVNVSATRTSAQVGGVVLTPARTPDAAQGQLWSFSRFKAKDPFVPQVKDVTSAAGSSSGSAATTAAGGTPGATSGAPVAAAAPPTYATLLVNGRPQQVTLDKPKFPKFDPIFVLVKIVGKNARIGVAGGSFTAGNTLLLELGKRVTLMNTTTGQRYVVKLVYVGDQPETIAVFKGGKTAPPAAGVTTTTTTTATAAPGTTP